MSKIVKLIEEVEVKKLLFKVELEYYFDEEINEFYVDEELGNKNLRTIRNEYRRQKGLLLDYGIKQIREKYELSQKDFAILLGLGEVTITRYESKTIQDKAQDEIIRSAKNPEWFYQRAIKNKDNYIKEYSEEKFSEILERIKKQISVNEIEYMYSKKNFSDEYTGKKTLSLNKIYSIINRLCLKLRLTKTKLAKLLWYIDFLAYKRYGCGITGLSYCHLKYGAIPFMFENLLNDDCVRIEQYINEDAITYLITGCDIENSLTEDEMEIVDYISNIFKEYDTSQIVEKMHEEKAYLETKANEYISYKYADDLQIDF